MVFGEKSASGMFQVQHSDHFVFVNQRHGEFRASLGIQQDVTRIFTDVGHQYRLPMLDGVAHYSLAQPDVVLKLDVFLKAQRKPVLQLFSRRVQKEDTKHLVIDEAAQQFGDTLEQLIYVQN